jgi:putative hydroxymethylpyrimidine transport system ATP-binding protein
MKQAQAMPGDAQVKFPSAPGIRLERVSFAFGDIPLFEDFDFTAPPGQWTCLLGASGCGKSTLLRLISGSLNSEVKGRIRFDGEPNKAGLVAWMAQKDLLLPWLSVLNNVMLGARLRGDSGPDTRERALGLLQEAGLAECAEALPEALSGGMRQRAALIRTLMEQRPVILMDEPFSALDALTRLKLQNLAARMVKGATVVLVTHDPWEALRLGHRIQVIKGRPARLSPVFSPPGDTPRDPSQKEVAATYPRLLEQLGSAEEP